MTTVQHDPRTAFLEPQTLAFLKGLEAQGGPPLYTLTPAQAREVLVAVQASASVTKPPAEIEDRTIAGGPTGEIALRIVRPQGATGTLPGIVYCHGGGWILGDKETHDRLVREIAAGVQATVVFVDYTRSPEAHYPIAVEQAYAALVWAAEQGAAIGVDSSRLAVIGESVGGNMAAVLALLAKEQKGPTLTFQALFYPVTDAEMDTASYQRYGDGSLWLSAPAMKWFWDSYAPEVAQRKDHYQGRQWEGLHRHLALVMLAYSFLMLQRLTLPLPPDKAFPPLRDAKLAAWGASPGVALALPGSRPLASAHPASRVLPPQEKLTE